MRPCSFIDTARQICILCECLTLHIVRTLDTTHIPFAQARSLATISDKCDLTSEYHHHDHTSSSSLSSSSPSSSSSSSSSSLYPKPLHVHLLTHCQGKLTSPTHAFHSTRSGLHPSIRKHVVNIHLRTVQY